MVAGEGVHMDATVGRFASRAEAEMARQLLDDAGIPARIRTDDAGAMHPELGQVGAMHGITLVVFEEDRAEAQEFLVHPADVPADWEEPDRSRAGTRLLAFLVLVLVFGVGLFLELSTVVDRLF